MNITELKTAIKLLRDVDALFSSSSRWTKWTMARGKHNLPVGPCSPEAVCWCLVGAGIKCGSSVISQYLDFDAYASQFNDASTTTFTDVKALLTKSIKKLEAQL